MKLQVTIEPVDRPAARRVELIEAAVARLGTPPDVTVALPGWEGEPLTIEQDDAGGWRLIAPASAPPMALAGRPVVPGQPEPLRNGDELRLGETLVLHVAMRFARVGTSRRVALLPRLTVGLIALIVLFELGVGFWLPFAARNRERWGTEVARQRVILLSDALRQRLPQLRQRHRDIRSQATLALIDHELIDLASYLREYEERLTPVQINQVAEDLEAFHEVLRALAADTLYPSDRRIDADAALRHLLPAEEFPDEP